MLFKLKTAKITPYKAGLRLSEEVHNVFWKFYLRPIYVMLSKGVLLVYLV